MNPYRHRTIIAIIALAVLVFLAEQAQHTTLFAESWGAVPLAIRQAFDAVRHGELSATAARDLSRLVTALFLHGDFEHILYNMVFLWAFGYLTSEYLGEWWALGVFLSTGICGNVVQVSLNPNSMIPAIGASGAVCGFEGVYLGLALRWQLPWPDVWPLAHPIPPFQLAAFAVIGFVADAYFLMNHAQHIAYGAHVGGFLSGLVIALVVTTVWPTREGFRRGWQTR